MHNLHNVATHLRMYYLVDLSHSPSHESPPAKRRKYDRSDGTYICIYLYSKSITLPYYMYIQDTGVYKKSNLRKGSRDHNKK